MLPHTSPRPARRPALRPARRSALRAVALTAAAVTFSATAAVPSYAASPTPGDFRGYGFDQCETVSQTTMDRWRAYSPFQAVGVYISGKSRYCRTQANLTPIWVKTQLAKQWKILPITLGAQASCSARYPRWGNDPVIIDDPTTNYAKARSMAVDEANTAAAEATRLGIPQSSTLWYDLEGFPLGDTRCEQSALAFVHAWTNRLHALGFVAGLYSSAGSGLKIVDDARVSSTNRWTMPDRIWIARWDGEANVSTSYLRPDGWMPGNRMKQYQGGHNETWGNVTVNIDSNYLQLGNVAAPLAQPAHCGGINIDFATYPVLTTTNAGSRGDYVKALKCLLTEQGFYSGELGPSYSLALRTAANNFKRSRNQAVGGAWRTTNWVAIFGVGPNPLLKLGSVASANRRVQRALNAAVGAQLPISGAFTDAQRSALKKYQATIGQAQTGNVLETTWSAFARGKITR